MRACAFAWLGLLVASLLIAAPGRLCAQTFEDAVLSDLNQVRAHPQAYARELRRRQLALARYDMGGYGVSEDEAEALDDAVDFLMRQAPLPPLARDGRLAAAARIHVARQSRSGEVGHGAPGGLGQRLQRAGVYAGLEAESISYGQRTPADVVRQLVVDTGVPNRAHRRDLFSHAYQAAGVACGPHAQWGSMCVIDLAGAMVRR